MKIIKSRIIFFLLFGFIFFIFFFLFNYGIRQEKLFAYNIFEEEVISSNILVIGSIDLSNDYIVYAKNHIIYCYDIKNKLLKSISDTNYESYYPQINGSKVVWQQHTEGNIQIYFYDILKPNELARQICPISTQTQIEPDIFGDYIIYYGFNNYPDYYYIYLFNINDGNPPKIISGKIVGNHSFPQIYGNYIVWVGPASETDNNPQIYFYDINKGGDAIKIYPTSTSQWWPRIYDNKIIWRDTDEGKIYLYYIDDIGSIIAPIEIGSSSNLPPLNPSINDNKITWVGYESINKGKVFLCDLFKGYNDVRIIGPKQIYQVDSNACVFRDRISWIGESTIVSDSGLILNKIHYIDNEELISANYWNGVPVLYNENPDGEYQCVELVRRFCDEKDLGTIPHLGDPGPAYTLWNKTLTSNEFQKISNSDINPQAPQWGDILIFNNTLSGWEYGHVAAVSKVKLDAGGKPIGIYFVQQNVNSNSQPVAEDYLPLDDKGHILTNEKSIIGNIRYPEVIGWIHSIKGDQALQELLNDLSIEFNLENMGINYLNVDYLNLNGDIQLFNFQNTSNLKALFLVNWPGSTLKLSVYKPDGTLYQEVQSDTPPLKVEIDNAVVGEWSYSVEAIDIPQSNYAFAVGIGTELWLHDQVVNFTTRFYTLCLGRSPDQSGLQYWANELISGSKTAEDLGYGFVMSDEYIAKSKSDTEFITMLYNVFLDRDPDAGGLAFWLEQLSRATRPGVLNGFIHSAEFESICNTYGITAYTSGIPGFVTRFYTLTLERMPDIEGRDYWVDLISSGGKTGEDIAYGFIFSDEFLAHNHPNGTYISILYNAFFDRVPDEEGYNYWLGLLDSGTSRQDILDSFIHSDEFEAICSSYGIEAYY